MGGGDPAGGPNWVRSRTPSTHRPCDVGFGRAVGRSWEQPRRLTDAYRGLRPHSRLGVPAPPADDRALALASGNALTWSLAKPTARVCEEGSVVPGANVAEGGDMQSVFCATFRARSNIWSNAPIGGGATNSPPGRRISPSGGPGSPAGGTHQQHRLLGRNQPLGAVRPEGGAGLAEVEGAEEVLVEEAVLAGRWLGLARHPLGMVATTCLLREGQFRKSLPL
jgi:hypothetical protein